MVDAPKPDDDTLFFAWRDGDNEAGRALFSRYFDPVARFFLGKVGDQTPDLLQRTFLGCLEGAHRYRGEGAFRSYLYGIAYKTLCKHYKERDRAAGLGNIEEVSIFDLEPSPSALIAQQQEQQILLEALRRLPLQVQVILELFYWEHMSGERIGEVLEIPVGTVRTKLRRGKLRLREIIKELATSEALKRSTLEDLDAWARSVRDQLRP